MSLIEELGRDAILIALTSPRNGIHTDCEWDGNRNVYTHTAIQLDSIAQVILNAYVKDKKDEQEELAKIFIEYLKEHPEKLVETILKELVKDRGNFGSGFENMMSLVREAGGRVLENDEVFQEKILDMARLSKSDIIKVNVQLAPAGQ